MTEAGAQLTRAKQSRISEKVEVEVKTGGGKLLRFWQSEEMVRSDSVEIFPGHAVGNKTDKIQTGEKSGPSLRQRSPAR